MVLGNCAKPVLKTAPSYATVGSHLKTSLTKNKYNFIVVVLNKLLGQNLVEVIGRENVTNINQFSLIKTFQPSNKSNKIYQKNVQINSSTIRSCITEASSLQIKPVKITATVRSYFNWFNYL